MQDKYSVLLKLTSNVAGRCRKLASVMSSYVLTHMKKGLYCHLDTDIAACRQGNGLISVHKVTLTVLQKQGKGPP